MPDTLTTINNLQVLVCSQTGEKLSSEQDAVNLIGEAMAQGADLVVVPVERLAADFFELKTRLAGLFVQKFVNYQRRLAILGDISEYTSSSRSLRDFVYETNKGNQFWFITTLDELAAQLGRPGNS